MMWDHEEPLGQALQDALRSRAVIEQAKGVIMIEQQVDANEAFQLMTKASKQRQVKVRDVAAFILDDCTSN